MCAEVAIAGAVRPFVEVVEGTVLVADVVVDHVEDDGEAALVAGVDQRAQVGGAAVGRLEREVEGRVVAPGAIGAELLHGQQRERVETQLPDVVELGLQLRERGDPARRDVAVAVAGEGADVALVQDQVVEGRACRRLTMRGSYPRRATCCASCPGSSCQCRARPGRVGG